MAVTLKQGICWELQILKRSALVDWLRCSHFCTRHGISEDKLLVNGGPNTRPLGFQLASQLQLRPFSTQTEVLSEDVQPVKLKPTSEIPGFHSKSVLKNIFDMTIFQRGPLDSKRFHLVWADLFREFGPIIRMRFPGQPPMVGIYDPDEIKKVYQITQKNPIRNAFHTLRQVRKTAEGDYFEGNFGLLVENNDEWWRVRSKVQKPMMNKKNIALFLPAMDAVAMDFMDRIAMLQKEKGEMPENFQQDLYKWALESVSLVALNRRLGCLDPNLSKDSKQIKLIESVNGIFEELNTLEVSFHMWRWFPPMLKKLDRYHRQFLEIADAAISETEAALLAKSKYTDEEGGKDKTLMEALLNTPGLSKKDVVTLMLDMLFAGIDTTSHTIAFLLYLLARHPHCQRKLQEEVDSVLGNKNSSEFLTEADLSKLKYMKCCIKESMRVFPLVLGTARVLEEDIDLHGYVVPKGDQVINMNYITTRSEEHFYRPNEFLPERWMPAVMKNIHPYASIPFSHGLRMCIGRRIAEQEMYVFAARVMQRFTVDYKYKDIELLARMVMTPSEPLRFSFTERK